MTNEEALKLLKDYEYWADISPIFDACEAAIEALEKQIPIKPYKVGVMEYECPNISCRKKLAIGYPCKCGQVLDWRDEE